MKLQLVRFHSDAKHTLGLLHIDGEFECFTLEDTVRDLEGGEKKVYGETGIPAGTYSVTVDESRRFKKRLPRLLMVPHFTGIRIHSGNTAEDSHGCILVGQTCERGFIGRSRPALKTLLGKLEACHEEITIEVI